MKRRARAKYLRKGQYLAKVEVALIEDETDWSPYLSIDDAYKLDDVQDTLHQGNLGSEARYGRIYDASPGSSASVIEKLTLKARGDVNCKTCPY